jgi:hypothetical protein
MGTHIGLTPFLYVQKMNQLFMTLFELLPDPGEAYRSITKMHILQLASGWFTVTVGHRVSRASACKCCKASVLVIRLRCADHISFLHAKVNELETSLSTTPTDWAAMHAGENGIPATLPTLHDQQPGYIPSGSSGALRRSSRVNGRKPSTTSRMDDDDEYSEDMDGDDDQVDDVSEPAGRPGGEEDDGYSPSVIEENQGQRNKHNTAAAGREAERLQFGTLPFAAANGGQRTLSFGNRPGDNEQPSEATFPHAPVPSSGAARSSPPKENYDVKGRFPSQDNFGRGEPAYAAPASSMHPVNGTCSVNPGMAEEAHRRAMEWAQYQSMYARQAGHPHGLTHYFGMLPPQSMVRAAPDAYILPHGSVAMPPSFPPPRPQFGTELRITAPYSLQDATSERSRARISGLVGCDPVAAELVAMADGRQQDRSYLALAGNIRSRGDYLPNDNIEGISSKRIRVGVPASHGSGEQSVGDSPSTLTTGTPASVKELTV